MEGLKSPRKSCSFRKTKQNKTIPKYLLGSYHPSLPPLTPVPKWHAVEMMTISKQGTWRFDTKQSIPRRHCELKVTPYRSKADGVCMTE